MTKKTVEDVTDEKYNKAVKSLVSNILMQEVLSGTISQQDIEDGSALSKIVGFYDSSEKYRKFLVSHTDEILKRARRDRTKFPEEAILHYALYIEHQINRLIRIFSERNDIDHSAAVGLMRELKISSKATWALELLGGEAFNNDIVNKINRISEERNAYVHYKWTKENPDTDEDKLEWRRQVNVLLLDAEIVVSELDSYENMMFYGGKRSTIIKNIFGKNRKS